MYSSCTEMVHIIILRRSQFLPLPPHEHDELGDPDQSPYSGTFMRSILKSINVFPASAVLTYSRHPVI